MPKLKEYIKAQGGDMLISEFMEAVNTAHVTLLHSLESAWLAVRHHPATFRY